MNALLTHTPESTTHAVVLTAADRWALRLGRWLIAHAERPRPGRVVPAPDARDIAEEAREAHMRTIHRTQGFGARWN